MGDQDSAEKTIPLPASVRRSLAQLPPRARQAALDAYLAAGRARRPSPAPARRDRRNAIRAAQALSRALALRPSPDPLALWLPGLILPSINQMIGSGKRQHQARAKAQAREAIAGLLAAGARVWSFDRRVVVDFRQQLRDRWAQHDPANLYPKHVLDLLTARHVGGLGIIADDSARHVARVACEIEPGDPGLWIILAPAVGAEPFPPHSSGQIQTTEG